MTELEAERQQGVEDPFDQKRQDQRAGAPGVGLDV